MEEHNRLVYQRLLKKNIENDGIKAINYGTVNCEYTGGSLPVIVCEDFDKLGNNICYEGSHPKSADEIAVGSARYTIRKHMTAIDVLLDKYYRYNIELDDMNALIKTIDKVGSALDVEISILTHEKIKTTTKMKL